MQHFVSFGVVMKICYYVSLYYSGAVDTTSSASSGDSAGKSKYKVVAMWLCNVASIRLSCKVMPYAVLTA